MRNKINNICIGQAPKQNFRLEESVRANFLAAVGHWKSCFCYSWTVTYSIFKLLWFAIIAIIVFAIIWAFAFAWAFAIIPRRASKNRNYKFPAWVRSCGFNYLITSSFSLGNLRTWPRQLSNHYATTLFFHYTCFNTSKRVTSWRAHLRVIAPVQTQLLLKKCCSVGGPLTIVFDLTGPRFESQTFRSRYERVIARL